ncbi:MAG: cyclic nucleotide-binding domain-containing protein [Parvibaculaceae bacterium]
MSLKSIIGLLRRHDLFAGLAEARLEVIAFTAERQTFEAGELLYEAGEEGHEALLILEGEAEMAGETIAAGDLIGEAALLSLAAEGPRRRASVRARTRVEALSVSRYLFQRLMQEFPEMAGTVAAALTRRLAQTTQEMTFLARDLEGMGAKRRDGKK